MNKWIAEFELEDGDTMPEHMDMEYKGARIDFHCKPLEQEPTTKNDLGVDCISRQEVIDELKRYFHDEYYQRTSIQDCRNCFIEDVLKHLPSVTPQEPKTGHWVEQIDHEENCRTLICSNCDRPALHDEDSIWKHKFCPHCGAKMIEPQESEDKE